MKIGELAARVGMAPSAIRYYERVGLIDAPERVGGQRSFSQRVVQTLRFIQLAQAGGFTIAEIKSIIDGCPGMSPGDAWHDLALQKKADVARKIHELERMDAVLDALLSCECATIDECVRRAEDS